MNVSRTFLSANMCLSKISFKFDDVYIFVSILFHTVVIWRYYDKNPYIPRLSSDLWDQNILWISCLPTNQRAGFRIWLPYFLISLPRQLFFFEFIKAWKFYILSSLTFPLCNENLNIFLTRWGNYSRRGNYSREETIWGNTVPTRTNLQWREARQMTKNKIITYSAH